MPHVEQHRSFTASIEEARNAAWDALASLGAEVTVSEDGHRLVAVTGWSLFSFFGEHVQVDLQPQDEQVAVTVRSRQSRGQMLDLSRRSHKNVGSVLSTPVVGVRLR